MKIFCCFGNAQNGDVAEPSNETKNADNVANSNSTDSTGKSHRLSVVQHNNASNNAFSPSLMLSSSSMQRQGQSTPGSPKTKLPILDSCAQVLGLLEQAMSNVQEVLQTFGEVAVASGNDNGNTSLHRNTAVPSSPDGTKKKGQGKNLWTTLKSVLKGKDSSSQRVIIEKIYSGSRSALIQLDIVMNLNAEGSGALVELGQEICNIASDSLTLFHNLKAADQASLHEYISSRVNVALQTANLFVMSLKMCFSRAAADPKTYCRDQAQSLQRSLESIANSASELYYHIDMEPAEFFYLLACDIEKKLALLNQYSSEEEQACKGRYVAFGNQIHFAGRQVTKILRDLIISSPMDKAFLETSKRLAFSCNEIIDYVRRAISSVSDAEFQHELQENVEEMMLASIVLFNTLATSPENSQTNETENNGAAKEDEECREVSIDGDSDAAQVLGVEAILRLRVEKHIRIVFVACANLMRKAKQGMTSLVACEANIVALGDILNIIDSELLIAKDNASEPKLNEVEDFSHYAYITKSMLGNISNLTSSIGEFIGSDTSQPQLTAAITDVCVAITTLQEALCAAARSLTPKHNSSQIELLGGVKKLIESYINFLKSTYSVIRRLGVSQAPSKSFASWISQQFGLLSHVSSIIDQIKREIGPFPSDFLRPAYGSVPRTELSLTGATVLSTIPPILERMTEKVPGTGPYNVSVLVLRKLLSKASPSAPPVAADGLIRALGDKDANLNSALQGFKDAVQDCKQAYELARKSGQQYQNLSLVSNLEQKTDSILFRTIEKVHDYIRSITSGNDFYGNSTGNDDAAYVMQLVATIRNETVQITETLNQFLACGANDGVVAQELPAPNASSKVQVGSSNEIAEPIKGDTQAVPKKLESVNLQSTQKLSASQNASQNNTKIFSAEDQILSELASNLESQIASLTNNIISNNNFNTATLDASKLGQTIGAAAGREITESAQPKIEIINDTVDASSFQKQLQKSTKAIATACLAVFQALTRAQREISKSSMSIEKSEKGLFVKSATDLASRVGLLGTHVNGYCQGGNSVTIELLRASTKSIIQQCLQVITASSAKTNILSNETVALCRDASKNVVNIAERLVKVIDDATKQLDVEEGGEDMKELIAAMNKKQTNTGAIAQELEAQAEILKMEKELAKARNRLVDLRKQAKTES